MTNLNYNLEPYRYIDEVTDELFYIGVSNNGNSTDRPIWNIKKIEKIGTEWRVSFPEGKQQFKFVWDERYLYDYK